ncbi:MAG: glycosyltransferase [Proteobacteria bacterium]|nr:glycosyltransferase [Pseudomonadota bacterium]
MKSLLIVTEQFTLGGLETHIRDEIELLTRIGIEVHLAVGKRYEDLILLPGLASITKGLPFDAYSTSSELVAGVDQIRQIICDRKIDRLHIHPFASIIPAATAAELEGIPYAITMHGPASVLTSYGPVYDLLLKKVILPNVPLLVAVSPEVKSLLTVGGRENAVLCIPNSVVFPLDEGHFCSEPRDPRWLVVSRLDEFKIQGIIDFCRKARCCGVSGVVIAGDGPAREQLSSMLDAEAVSDFVELIGASNKIASLLKQFAGVAGMGRVVLEAVSARKSVVLVGYDGVKGVLDKNLFKNAAEQNFSGRNLPVIDGDLLSAQLRELSTPAVILDVFNYAKRSFDAINAWAWFSEEMGAARNPEPTILTGLYKVLSSNTDVDATPFVMSGDVLNELEILACCSKYYDQKLLEEVATSHKNMDHLNSNQAVLESDRLINEQNRTVAEFGRQIKDLNETLADRDRTIRVIKDNCRRIVEEKDLYIEDKEIYIVMLKLENERLSMRWGNRVIRSLAHFKRLSHYAREAVVIAREQGGFALVRAVRTKIRDVVLKKSIAKTSGSSDQNLGASRNVISPKGDQIILPLLRDALVIIAGVPFDDIGGGQRSAQIARSALKMGRHVVYVYIYKKFDFDLNRHVESIVNVPGLWHVHVDAATPTDVLRSVTPGSTLLIEFPHPKALPYLETFNLRGMRTVFELIDDWDSSLGGDWFDYETYRDFVGKSNVVVGTAKVLVNKLRDLGRVDAIYLPNAANECIFDKYKKYTRPFDMPTGFRRIALYFGSLYGEWFSWDYLREAAVNNGDIAFILIGDKPARDRMPSLPSNVYFLGGKSILDLPAYLAYADCSLLPFVPGKISDAVSPIKVFEYLFAACPVVATELPEIVDYPGVSVAQSAAEFSALCRDVALTDEARCENDKFIFSNSWFSRVEKIMSAGAGSQFRASVSVVILIHDNMNIIGRCLESLLLHCSSYLKEVIVVDNASADGGADFVRSAFPQVKVLSNPVNGCSSGRNLGARFATGELLAFFDSDQWFTCSSAFEEALTILTRDASVGAVGWAAGWFDRGRDDLGGPIADYFQNKAMNEQANKVGYRSDIGYLGTGGFFLHRSVFDATGGFDVAYDPTCFEDTDLSFQIKKLGFDVCYRDLVGIRHQPHQTTKASSGSDAYSRLFKRNADYFRRKWADYPHFYSEYHG